MSRPGSYALALRATARTGRMPVLALLVAGFGLLLIAAIWGLTRLQIAHETAEATTSEFAKNRNLAVAHEAHVMRLLQNADQLALLLKESYGQASPQATLQHWLATGIVDTKTYNYVGIFDARGDMIASGPAAAPVNLADRAFFQYHRNNPGDGLRIGEAIQVRATGRWGIALSRRIDRPDGTFAGALEMVIDARFFTSLFQDFDLGPDDSLTLARPDGVVLARRVGPRSSFGESIAGTHLLAEQRKSPEGSYLMQSTLDGKRRFVSYRTLKDYALIAAVATSEAEVLAPLRQRATRYYASAAAASAFVFSFCAILVFVLLRQRRAAEALRASEEGLATTLHSIGDGVIATDTQGRITRMNPAAELLTGWNLESARGRPMEEVFRIVHTQTRETVADPVGQVLGSDGGVSLPAQTTLLARGGAEYSVADSAAPIRNTEGELTGAVLVFSDITRSERVEQARASLEGQLRESQKMEAIGTLAGGVAHDFNNILAIILGNTSLARQDTAGQSAVQECLEEIHKAGARGRDLVQQILSFSRRQPTTRQRISMGAVVDESVRLLRATLPARVTLDVYHAPVVPEVLADFSQMQQVLINLATNAAQAMQGAPGRVSIRVDSLPIDADLVAIQPALAALHARYHGPAVRLAVSDTGRGMDAATLARIFEPFFTTKPLGEGTGLGLSVVHGIVQAHEGAIVVQSEAGRGSSFSIYLPAAPGPAQESAPRSAWTRDAPGADAAPATPAPATAPSAGRRSEPAPAAGKHSEPAPAAGGRSEPAPEAVSGLESESRSGSGSGSGLRLESALPNADDTAEAPRAMRAVAGSGAGTASPEDPAHARRRLLYIDDDEFLVHVLKRLLGRRGYSVTGYVHSRAALDDLRLRPGAYDLVVTDFNMPGMSGLDVAREVRAIRADLPVAVASGLITDELREQAEAAGVSELIFKATEVDELCEAFDRVGKQHFTPG